jgi:transposase
MANATGKHRRKFTPDYRREAARLVIDTGRTVAEVAREIGVVEQTLGRWVAAEKRAAPGLDRVSESERAELERLRAEVAQLKMDNDFLARAASFFASRQQNRIATR